MNKLHSLLSASLGAAVAVGGLVVAAVPAAAGTTPPWQGVPTPTSDVHNVGTLAIYDASGTQITTGSTQSPIGAYVLATGLTAPAGSTKAVLFAYTPVSGTAPGGWSGKALTGSTVFPNASAPGALGSSTQPLVTTAATDATLDDYATNEFPNTSTTAGYQNVYELRLKTVGSGGADVSYASADLIVDNTAHTWTETYGTGVGTPATTTTSLALSAPGTVAPGTAETLTATTTSGVAGSVSFTDNGAAVGTATAVDTGTGKASTTVTPAVGAHSYVATFTPTDTGAHAPSTSTAVAVTVAKATPTVTATLTPASTKYGKSASLHVVVTAAGQSPTGTVTVTGKGVAASAPLAAGAATVALPATLAAGKDALTVTYSGDANVAGGTTAATLTVTKASITLTAKLARATVKANQHAKVTITAKGTGFTPGGAIQIKKAGKVIAKGTLKAGKVTITLPTLKKGTYSLVVAYPTTANVAAATKTVKLTVKAS